MFVEAIRRFQGFGSSYPLKSLLLCFSRQVKVNIPMTCFSNYRDNLDGIASYTLQTRLLKFLRTNSKYKENTILLDKENALKIPNSLEVMCNESEFKKAITDLSQEQLAHYIYQLSRCESQLSVQSFQSAIRLADKECCIRLGDMDRRVIMKSLDAWFYVLPHRITSLQFYSLFVNKVYIWMSVSNCKIEDLLQPMFYTGLQKKTFDGRKVISKCLKSIDSSVNNNVSVEELCILTNAAYKTSTKITSINILTVICNVINSNLMKLLSDEALFVTLIKSLRHAQFHDINLMNNIANMLMLNIDLIKNFNFTTKAHLLAFYADALYAKDNLIHALINSCVSDLSLVSFVPTRRSDHLSIRPRVKDISRFLWAVSYLGFHLNHNDIEGTIIPQLMNRLTHGEYSRNPEQITSSLLSVWIMGYKPKDLFQKAVTQEAMACLECKKRYRYNSRLSLLLRCVNIEMPQLLSKEHLKWKSVEQAEANIEKQLQKRNMLQKVYTAVKCLSRSLKYEHVMYEFIIPNLHLAGIVIRNLSGCVLHIEVLDPTVCLYKSHEPHGLMQLKLRLLKALGNEVLVINQSQFEHLADTSSLYMFLEDELMKHVRQI